ncbi:MAG: DNA repair protein RadC [Clostridiales bacterium]|jgi:DNA repair protein RadC|nr:DNA repair protein RadC [Clostridiales bacterium]
MSKKVTSNHNGHRDRMRDKFLLDGLDVFEPHEALEMLLYYAVPRKNTNELAHMLIQQFGSLSAVFDAPVDTLMKVGKLTKCAAILIKLTPQIARIYLEDKHKRSNKLVSDDVVGDLLMHKFVGRTNETVILVLMDGKRKQLYCGVVNEGNINGADIYMRKIVELAMRYNASLAILAHNHPSGIALPSRDDLVATASVRDALQLIGVKLIDHIIVADDDYVSLNQSDFEDPITGESLFL